MDDADSSKPQRVIGRPFQPGQSGNPGGKDPEIEVVRIACRNYMTNRCQRHLETIDRLASEGTNEKVQLTASIWWAEQVLGKAMVSISGPNGGPLEVSAKELHERLSAILDRAPR